MNKYVIAYWSDLDGVLVQAVVEGTSDVAVTLKYMQWEDQKLTTMEEIYSLAANCDSMINIVQIS